MTQRTLRSILAGGALVAALTLASPAPAHAATGPGLAGLWSWLAGSWGDRVAVLGGGTKQTQKHGHRLIEGLEKAGSCVDPNGCANHQTAGTASPACWAWNDAGSCADSNN